jgi:hypothetical protein
MAESLAEKPSATVAALGDRLERRARLRPWGVEIEVWRLVETVTVPDTAGSLSISSLFSPTLGVERLVDGALPGKLLPATDADPTTPTPLTSSPLPAEQPEYEVDYPEHLSNADAARLNRSKR